MALQLCNRANNDVIYSSSILYGKADNNFVVVQNKKNQEPPDVLVLVKYE